MAGILELDAVEQSAATTGNGTVTDCSQAAAREHTWYLTPTGTVSAGAVTIETAATAAYTGTWAVLGGPITLVNGATLIFNYTGALLFTRVRISTNITGGATLVARHVAF